MIDDESVWLSERQAGELLGRSPSAVKRLRLSRQLSYLAGRPIRIRKSDVEDYIARNMVLANAELPVDAQQRISNAEARSWAIEAKFKGTNLRRRGR